MGSFMVEGGYGVQKVVVPHGFGDNLHGKCTIPVHSSNPNANPRPKHAQLFQFIQRELVTSGPPGVVLTVKKSLVNGSEKNTGPDSALHFYGISTNHGTPERAIGP
jgi:hypothetical protein